MSPSSERAEKRLIVAPLLRRESIGDAYHILSFDLPEGSPARAGQFAMVRGAEWGDAPLLPRPMSYLTGGTTPSILIKVVGEGTLRMARAEPGEPFSLLGPLGNTWRPHTPGRKQVLVGGGVGIAPLLFLARQLQAEGADLSLIYGGRSARDLPLVDEARELGRVELTTEDGSLGTHGRVTDVLARVIDANAEVYTCGPDRMMAKVAEMCSAADVPCEVSVETPMACGYGVCLGCPVPTTSGGYLYACVEGPCIDARRIDWSVAEHPPRKAFGSKGRPL